MRGLVFETSDSLAALAATVGTACRLLTDANVPHNLFIVDRGSRVFLLPNAFAERKVLPLFPPLLRGVAIADRLYLPPTLELQ